MRAARILCLIGLILAWAAPQAAAFDGNTDVIGFIEGSRWYDSCREGGFPKDALVAIDYVTGKDMDMVTAVCAEARDGKPNTGSRRLITRGLDDGGDHVRGTVHCRTGQVVQAIYVTISNVLVHHFWLVCRNPFTGEHYTTPETGSHGGQGGTPGSMDCGDDGYAYGLLGRSSARIFGLGLMCATFPVPAPPPPPPPPPPQQQGGGLFGIFR